MLPVSVERDVQTVEAIMKFEVSQAVKIKIVARVRNTFKGLKTSSISIGKVKVKVNQSRYRPGVAQRVPGS